MKMKWIVAAACLVATTSAAAPQQAGAPTSGEVLTFESGPNGMPLEDFIERASAILDAPIFYDKRVMPGRVLDFEGKVEVPRERFLAFFEQRLFEKRFVHLERMIGSVTSHSVMRLEKDRRENLPLKTVVHPVDRAELMRMSDRQSLVIAILYCTTIPADQVVEAIVHRLDASLMEDVRRVEGTNAVLVHSFAAKLASLLPDLERLGVHVAERHVEDSSPGRAAVASGAVTVLHREAGGLHLAHAIDAMTRLIDEPIFFDKKPVPIKLVAVAEQRIDFAGDVPLDRSNALAWFDAILGETWLSRQTRTIASQPIQVLWVHRGMHDRVEARWVSPDELTSIAGEFVSTSVDLDRIRSDELVDSICCRFGALNQDMILAIRGTNSFVITGAADKLAVYVEIAREIDRNATIEPPKPAKK